MLEIVDFFFTISSKYSVNFSVIFKNGDSYRVSVIIQKVAVWCLDYIALYIRHALCMVRDQSYLIYNNSSWGKRLIFHRGKTPSGGRFTPFSTLYELVRLSVNLFWKWLLLSLYDIGSICHVSTKEKQLNMLSKKIIMGSLWSLLQEIPWKTLRRYRDGKMVKPGKKPSWTFPAWAKLSMWRNASDSNAN